MLMVYKEGGHYVVCQWYPYKYCMFMDIKFIPYTWSFETKVKFLALVSLN